MNTTNLQTPRTNGNTKHQVNGDKHELDRNIILEQASAVDRLHVRRKSRLALLRKSIVQPQGSLPPTILPSWTKLDLSDKIPAPREYLEQFIFTRGGICQQVHRKLNSFTLEDPRNQKNLSTKTYNALHDPATQNYFRSPSVQKLLLEQGLMTPGGNVVCSLLEFNDWRAYLNASVYNDTVKQSLEQVETLQKAERKQQKHLHDFSIRQAISGDNYKRNQRYKKAQEQIRQYERKRAKKLMEQRALKNERVKKCKLCLTQQYYEQLTRNSKEEDRRQVKISRLRESENLMRNEIICKIQEKERNARIRKDIQKHIEMQRKKAKCMEYLKSKCEFQQETNDREELIEQRLRNNLRIASEQRLRQVKDRRNLSVCKAKENMQVKARENFLARKYCEKWAKHTINRQMERCLQARISLFDLPLDLSQTLSFITTQTIASSNVETERQNGSDDSKLLVELNHSPKANGQCLKSESESDECFAEVTITEMPSKPELAKTSEPKLCQSQAVVGVNKLTKFFVKDTIDLILVEAKAQCYTALEIQNRKEETFPLTLHNSGVMRKCHSQDSISGKSETCSHWMFHEIDESVRIGDGPATFREQQLLSSCNTEHKKDINPYELNGLPHNDVTAASSGAMSSLNSLKEAMALYQTKDAQSDAFEEAIQKACTFSSASSFSEFANKVYQELSSLAVSKKSDFEISKCLERELGHTHNRVLQHDFFKSLIRLSVTKEDLKLLQKLDHCICENKLESSQRRQKSTVIKTPPPNAIFPCESLKPGNNTTTPIVGSKQTQLYKEDSDKNIVKLTPVVNEFKITGMLKNSARSGVPETDCTESSIEMLGARHPEFVAGRSNQVNETKGGYRLRPILNKTQKVVKSTLDRLVPNYQALSTEIIDPLCLPFSSENEVSKVNKRQKSETHTPTPHYHACQSEGEESSEISLTKNLMVSLTAKQKVSEASMQNFNVSQLCSARTSTSLTMISKYPPNTARKYIHPMSRHSLWKTKSAVNDVVDFLGLIIHHRVLRRVMSVSTEIQPPLTLNDPNGRLNDTFQSITEDVAAIAMELCSIYLKAEEAWKDSYQLALYKAQLNRLIECIATMIVAGLN